MNKIGLLLIFQIGLWKTAGSQVFATKQIGLGAGLSLNALKSDLISPYTHQGNSAPFQLYFRSGRAISRHHVQLQYSEYNLSSSSGGLSTSDQRGYLQYAYHRKIRNFKNSVTVFGGVVFLGNGSQRDNLINSKRVPGNNQAGELNISFSPSLLLEWSVKRSCFSFQGWLAVLNLTVQSGYALSFPEQINWLSLGDYTEYNSRFSYSKYVSSRFDLRIDYQFSFAHLTNYETLRYVSNQVVASLAYKVNR
ncbi:MAG: hypothetical protein ORN54_15095 [Cyclobacteriaceae bacterium]|nr:hypothetical protein [Cyclobacteriaceae bacterium]